jgi:hypothetical protein
MPGPSDEYEALKNGLIAESDAMRTIAAAVGRLGSQIEALLDSLPPETREALLQAAAAEEASRGDGDRPDL